MVVFDKVAWHIDGGESKETIVKRFRILFDFLHKNSLLSREGEEVYEFGIDSSISLHERLLTTEGATLMKNKYDESLTISNSTLFSFWEQALNCENKRNNS